MISKAEVTAIVRSVVTAVREFIDEISAELKARQDDFEKRLDGIPAGPKGEPGDRGEKGADGTGPHATSVAAELLPTAKDWLRELEASLSAQVDRRLSEIPPPQKGEPGEKGVDGAPGSDAIVDPSALAGLVAERVTEAVKALPQAERGEKGEPGESIKGDKGEAGESIKGDQGEKGEPGKDADPEEMKLLWAKFLELQGQLIKSSESLVATNDALIARGNELAALRETVAAMPVAKDGAPGARGEAGPQGERGEPGLTVKGDPGEPGKDAYAMACELGFDGTRSEWFKSLHGIDGTDAIAIKIIYDLDETRSYPKGTYALHKRCFMRAERATSNVTGDDFKAAGWKVIAGQATITVEHAEDLRTFVLRFAYPDGEIVEQSFALPVVLDRGPYVPGKEYTAGDHVFWGGSAYIATRTTTDAPKGSDAWRLSIKRGNDGKDWDDPSKKSNGHAVRI